MPRVIPDLTGRIFGRLTVTGKAASSNNHGRWRCLCQCGNVSAVPTTSLLRGSTRSCGCLRVERSRERGKRAQEVQVARDAAIRDVFDHWAERLQAFARRALLDVAMEGD